MGQGMGFAALDFEGNVTYARPLGLRTEAGIERRKGGILVGGYLAEDAEPFQLDPVPTPGTGDDAFLAILEEP